MVKRVSSAPFVRRRGSAADTAVRLYENQSHQITVVATVHRAVPDYYQRLAALIAERESAGAVVHAEALRPEWPEGTDTTPERQHEILTALKRQESLELDLLHTLGLDLISQGQGLTYSEGWPDVDARIGDLAELNTLVLQDTDAMQQQIHAVQNMSAMGRWWFTTLFRAVLYKGFDKAIATGGSGRGLADDLVSHWRSVNAVNIARRERRDVVMLWGGAHCAGIGALLSKMGYSLVETQWFTALPRRIPRRKPLAPATARTHANGDGLQYDHRDEKRLENSPV